MDEGTLRFKSGIDGTDYGPCLSGLRAFSRNGQKLYPAISATRQGAQIGIKYLGSAGILSYSRVVRYYIGPNRFHVQLKYKLNITVTLCLNNNTNIETNHLNISLALSRLVFVPIPKCF